MKITERKKWDDPEEQSQAKKDGPHSDCGSNTQYFHNMIGQCEFTPDVDIEVTFSNGFFSFAKSQYKAPLPKEKPEPIAENIGYALNAVFVIGPLGQRKGTYNISFHQISKEFKTELCNILNSMGGKGYLRKKGAYKTPEEAKRDSEYDKLFKGY